MIAFAFAFWVSTLGEMRATPCSSWIESPKRCRSPSSEEWQFIYNYRRSHGGLGGKTPAGRIAEVGERTPLSEVVAAEYDESKERIRYSDWKKDQAMAALQIALAIDLAPPNSRIETSVLELKRCL
jgi:hypothetical protein